MNEPRYKHTCPKCKYLGRYEIFDLYACKTHLPEPSVIARYGDCPNDYLSETVTKADMFGVAAQRSRAIGYLPLLGWSEVDDS